MQYKHVCLEAFGYTLPREILSSAELEARLEPLYERLRLPAGRLELMSGIRERRLWDRGVLPGDMSIVSAEQALAAADFDREDIGALIHASVCRDHLEPATAARVHHRLGLPKQCLVYDVSNACLGMLNGMLQVANMIELGQVRAGLVVGTEASRQILEATIDHLNHDLTLTRDSVKLAVASLTLGSASAAVLLVHKDLSRTGNRLRAAMALADTEHHGLCHSLQDEAMAPGARPLMRTDSERLLLAGVAAGRQAFERFLHVSGWDAPSIDKIFTHQVGVAHRKAMLSAFELDPARDFTTVERLGNTGAVALPITAALGMQAGHLAAGDRVAMLGIGSGINTVMLAVDWQQAAVAGVDLAADVDLEACEMPQCEPVFATAAASLAPRAKPPYVGAGSLRRLNKSSTVQP